MNKDVHNSSGRLAVLLLTLCAALLCAYWTLYVTAPGFHASFIGGEDRTVEWITFAGFLGSSIFCGLVTKRRKTMPKLAFLYFAGLGLFFFLCAGEEISWGQRILGFETPEAIAEINEQDEFNLHNLEIENFHPKDIVSWFMKLFGIGLPLLALLKPLRNKLNWNRYVSPLHVTPVFVFAELVNELDWLAGKIVSRYVDLAHTDTIVWQTEELVEMYWGLGIVIAFGAIWRYWEPKKRPGDNP